MKDYKLLLAGVILLLLIILLGIFAWLWNSNHKNINPLPVMASTDTKAKTFSDTEYDLNNKKDVIATNVLYVQAEEQLQVPLDDVIIRFESRYPNIQILARYVPTTSLLTLPDTSIADNDNLAAKSVSFIVTIDMIVADSKLSQTRLLSLQALLDNTQTEFNESQVNANGIAQDNGDTTAVKIDNNEERSLVSFSYAIKGEHTVDGVIITDNPIAISFRNFLLSSTGQDTLERYGYDNIDGYKNSMDDLFNSTSPAKTASGQPSVEVADALNSAE